MSSDKSKNNQNESISKKNETLDDFNKENDQNIGKEEEDTEWMATLIDGNLIDNEDGDELEEDDEDDEDDDGFKLEAPLYVLIDPTKEKVPILATDKCPDPKISHNFDEELDRQYTEWQLKQLQNRSSKVFNKVLKIIISLKANNISVNNS